MAEINASRPQCPVGLNTLVLPSKNTISDSDKTPYVYLNCGHVHGQHSWGKGVDMNNCTCPMCLKVYMLLVYHDSHCCNSPDWSIVAHVNRLLTYFFTSDVSSRYQLIQEETENFFIYKILLCVIFV